MLASYFSHRFSGSSVGIPKSLPLCNGATSTPVSLALLRFPLYMFIWNYVQHDFWCWEIEPFLPPNFMQGRVQGWRDAWCEVIRHPKLHLRLKFASSLCISTPPFSLWHSVLFGNLLHRRYFAADRLKSDKDIRTPALSPFR